MCEYNECPTCLQDWVDNTDYECGCGRPASEHIRVTSLCRILRETQQREHALIVKLEDAKTTADLWMKHAKHADEAAADLKAELAETRRHWKEEITSVQARLLDPHAVYINMLHGKIAKLDWEKLEHIHGNHPAREQLTAERALSDRLAEELSSLLSPLQTTNALAAWKEARSEI